MNPAAHIHAYDRDVLEGVLTQVLLCRQGMPKHPDSVGAAVVGTAVGLVVGVLVGVFVGRNVGYAVGACVVGLDVGATVSTHVWPVWAPWQPLVQRKPVAQAHAQPCALLLACRLHMFVVLTRTKNWIPATEVVPWP